jgi:hypothetical protein
VTETKEAADEEEQNLFVSLSFLLLLRDVKHPWGLSVTMTPREVKTLHTVVVLLDLLLFKASGKTRPRRLCFL